MSATRPTRIPLGDEPDDVLERATVCPASVAPCGDGASTSPAVHEAYDARLFAAVRALLHGATPADIRREHGRIVAEHAAALSGRQRLLMLARACGGAR